MAATSSSITTNSSTLNSVQNDIFSAGCSPNFMVLNPMYPGINSPSYAPNYTYPMNYFCTVPLWVQSASACDHLKNDDQAVANRLQNTNMTETNPMPSMLQSLCSNLKKFSSSSSNKSDQVLLQDCMDGLSEYAKNFNFQIPKEHPSRKRRRSFSSGYSTDSDYTDIDSECEDNVPPTELLLLEKSLHRIQQEYHCRSSKVEAKPFLPSPSTEQASMIQFDKNKVTKQEKPDDLTPKQENVHNKAPIGIQVETDANGNTIYKIREKPIKFKVVKNRPKNGLFSQTWEWHFDKLKDFQNRYGHTNVTRSVEGYEDIGTWVAEQRRKIKKGRITKDQFSKLNEIGFEWDRSYYFFNAKKAKSSSDEEVASLPSCEESLEGQPRKTSEQQNSLKHVL